MIDFMILGAPRSGTTWAANWLTTDTTVCVHDPLRLYALDVVNHIPTGGKKLGVSCTALPLFPDFVNSHPSPKVILHRPLAEVNQSLEALGLSGLSSEWEGKLEDLVGWHVPYQYIFEPDMAKKLYEYLLDRPFDYQRHQLLREMQIEPDIANVVHNPDAVRRVVQQLQGGA